VDADDPAFDNPTKFVGPVYAEDEAKRLAAERDWTVKQDGDKWRRVVASPMPQRIFQIRPVEWCLEKGAVVVCTGGGGIPTMYKKGTRELVGVEAVIDKDFSSMVLARDIEADMLIIATDADAVYVNWGTPEQKAIAAAHPDALEAMDFPAGSMGPKVDAACEFARLGKTAVIGALETITGILAGESGTRVSLDVDGVQYYQ
jgi:carbamate kinase